MIYTTIHGRLVRDPELKTSTSGSEYCRFCVASDRYNGKEKATDFLECVAWGQKGVAISKFFTKGKEIVAHGYLESTRKEKDGNKVTYWDAKIYDFEFCGSMKEAGGSAPEQTDSASGMPVVEPEELPF